MSLDFQRLERVLAEAAAKGDAEERAAYLAQACGDDAELRTEVERLLAAHEKAGDFLETPFPPIPDKTKVVSESDIAIERTGARIGRYRLLEEIGEGGFGVVYMAEQIVPVQRKVALKIIKAGMDTREVVARFEAERQALALMDHPNIAKVFDGGATQTGRPYFVMELVRGVAITDFCDQRKLSTRERLQLFIQVCHAVQHAHQKGIIHRDLKPSNILVTLIDGEALPKIIDFGVAKALGQRLTDKTLFTSFLRMVGTPAYMSPEQADLSGVDIDTRADIYALGVLLYELLTGVTPFDGETLRNAALDEIRRLIRETEPPKPSTRLRSLGEKVTTVAQHRQTEPAALNRLVRGDLDWIAMKCLEKDRRRRYETANSLADDIERHLDNEPVTAAAPSMVYRARKFISRHKAGVAVTGAMVLLLAAGVIVSSWQAIRATRAKAAAIAEKQRADKEAASAKRIAEYTQQMFLLASQEAAKGPESSVQQLLDELSSTLESQLAGQPEAQAAIHATIGIAYYWMEEHEKAKHHLTRALELRRALFGTQHEKYAESLVDYATMLSGDLHTCAEAERDFREALAVYRARRVEGAPVIHALWALQLACSRQQQWEKAEAVFREALAEACKSPRTEYWELTGLSNGLASARVAQGRFAEAESILRRTVTADKVGWTHKFLADALTPQHKFKEALAAAKQALAIMRKTIPPENMAYGTSLNSLLRVLREARSAHALAEVCTSPEELAALEPFFRERLMTKPRDADDVVDPVRVSARAWADFPGFYAELGNELSAVGKMQAAQECRQKAETLITNLLTEPIQGREQARTLARVLNQLAWQMTTSADSRHRDGPTALRLAERAVAVTGRTNAMYLDTLAAAYAAGGQFTNAVNVQEEAIGLLATDKEKGDYTLRLRLYLDGIPYRDTGSLATHALALLKEGKFAEAEPMARECLALRERLIPDDALTFNARSLLGGSLVGQRKYARAEPLLVAGYEGMKQREDQIPPGFRAIRLREALQRLVQLYEATGQSEKAAKYRQTLTETDESEASNQEDIL